MRTSGVYTINPDNRFQSSVTWIPTAEDGRCSKGEWTVVQTSSLIGMPISVASEILRRNFGPEMTRSVGLRKLCLQSCTWKCRTGKEHATAFAKYGIFRVGSESTKYELTVGSYSGSAGDSLSYDSASSFTTMDSDNDDKNDNCAVNSVGAWWYKSSNDSNLNGQYMGPGKKDSEWCGTTGRTAFRH